MRKWLYQTLITHEPLLELIGWNPHPSGDAELSKPSIYQSENYGSDPTSPRPDPQTALVVKPAIFYTMGTRTSLNFAEDTVIARQFFQLYVHDTPWDYQRIDQVIDILVRLLDQKTAPEEGVVRVEYMSRSSDMDDITLGTVMKYARFVAQVKEN